MGKIDLPRAGRLAPRHGPGKRFASGPVVGRARRSRHHAGPALGAKDEFFKTPGIGWS